MTRSPGPPFRSWRRWRQPQSSPKSWVHRCPPRYTGSTRYGEGGHLRRQIPAPGRLRGGGNTQQSRGPEWYSWFRPRKWTRPEFEIPLLKKSRGSHQAARPTWNVGLQSFLLGFEFGTYQSHDEVFPVDGGLKDMLMRVDLNIFEGRGLSGSHCEFETERKANGVRWKAKDGEAGRVITLFCELVICVCR